MKIGLILECQDSRNPGLISPDEIVCRHLINAFIPKAEFDVTYLGNKPFLIEKCGASANLMLTQSKCHAVMIVWDLYPKWKGQICQKRDRDAILENLKEAGVPDDAPVYLTCIAYELETWFLIEPDVIKAAGLRPKQTKRFKRVKNFEETDPKTVLSEYFIPYYSGKTVQVRQLMRGMKAEYFPRIRRKCASFDRFLKHIEKCRPTS